MTASASFANSIGRCAPTQTPFMDWTDSAGQTISAFQPARFTRFKMWSATKESISLKPSNVRTAILILFLGGPLWPRFKLCTAKSAHRPLCDTRELPDDLGD